MIRFFDTQLRQGTEDLLLTGDNAAHGRVLRLRAGEQVCVCDGAGMEALCEVLRCDGDGIAVKLLEYRPSETEAAVRISIYMAMPKGDKLEHVIQKATELGAFEIVTFPSARCVSRPDDKSLRKKQERWQKIASSAAEQSGRGLIPQVIVLGSYQAAIQRAAQAELPILLYENEHAVTLKMALESGKYGSISLISGPEGGLEASEVQQAAALGIRVCTLGNRILRCETAPLCGLSAVMYASGEF